MGRRKHRWDNPGQNPAPSFQHENTSSSYSPSNQREEPPQQAMPQSQLPQQQPQLHVQPQPQIMQGSIYPQYYYNTSYGVQQQQFYPYDAYRMALGQYVNMPAIPSLSFLQPQMPQPPPPPPPPPRRVAPAESSASNNVLEKIDSIKDKKIPSKSNTTSPIPDKSQQGKHTPAKRTKISKHKKSGGGKMQPPEQKVKEKKNVSVSADKNNHAATSLAATHALVSSNVEDDRKLSPVEVMLTKEEAKSTLLQLGGRTKKVEAEIKKKTMREEEGRESNADDRQSQFTQQNSQAPPQSCQQSQSAMKGGKGGADMRLSEISGWGEGLRDEILKLRKQRKRERQEIHHQHDSSGNPHQSTLQSAGKKTFEMNTYPLSNENVAGGFSSLSSARLDSSARSSQHLLEIPNSQPQSSPASKELTQPLNDSATAQILSKSPFLKVESTPTTFVSVDEAMRALKQRQIMKMARELTWDGKSHDGKASTIAAVNRTNGGICQSGKGGTQRKRKRWGFIDAKLTREEIDIGHSSVHDAQVTIDACNENKERSSLNIIENTSDRAAVSTSGTITDNDVQKRVDADSITADSDTNTTVPKFQHEQDGSEDYDGIDTSTETFLAYPPLLARTMEQLERMSPHAKANDRKSSNHKRTPVNGLKRTEHLTNTSTASANDNIAKASASQDTVAVLLNESLGLQIPPPPRLERAQSDPIQRQSLEIHNFEFMGRRQKEIIYDLNVHTVAHKQPHTTNKKNRLDLTGENEDVLVDGVTRKQDIVGFGRDTPTSLSPPSQTRKKTNISIPSSPSSVDSDAPLIDHWRQSRLEKRNVTLLGKRTIPDSSSFNETRKHPLKRSLRMSTERKRKKKKKKSKTLNSLFRHRIVLQFSHGTSTPALQSAQTDASNPSQFINESQPNNDSATKKGAVHGGPFGNLWEYDSDEDGFAEERVDVTGIEGVDIQSRSLPHARNEQFWTHQQHINEIGYEVPDTTTRQTLSLRDRVQQADMQIQFSAPSYLELKTKSWSSVENEETATAALVVAPSTKSFSSSNSAQDFLLALKLAAVEARRNSNGDDINPTTIVLDFLSIVKEAKSNSHTTTFRLMHQVWALIMSVVTRCNDGFNLGKKLASMFDAFLPQGYSMLSVNNLLLQGLNDRSSRMNIDLVEGCARTDLEYPFSRTHS